MNIAYTTNELFAAKVAASICSVFENNKGMDEIIIYIIGEGLSDKTIENYDKLSRKYKRDIRIIQLDDINKYLDFDYCCQACIRPNASGRNRENIIFRWRYD